MFIQGLTKVVAAFVCCRYRKTRPHVVILPRCLARDPRGLTMQDLAYAEPAGQMSRAKPSVQRDATPYPRELHSLLKAHFRIVAAVSQVDFAMGCHTRPATQIS